MSISSSSSVPSNFQLAHRSTRSKSPSGDRISVSTSAGHLRSIAADASLPGPHQRLRIVGTPRQLLPRNFPLSDVSEDEKNATSSPGSSIPPSIKKLHASPISADNQPYRFLSFLAFWLNWLGIVYCCLSVVFLSAIVFHRLQSTNYAFPSPPQPFRSYLSDRTNQELISMACSGIYPPPRAFDPFILRKQLVTQGEDAYNTTACLWLHDGELDFDSLISWSSIWSGPVSLVITTMATQPTAHIQSVLGRLSSSSRSSIISAHLLYLDPTSQSEAPNAYLNVARLFATTNQVLLFPANLSISPPPMSSLPPTLSRGFSVFLDNPGFSDQTLAFTQDFPFSDPTLAPILTRQDSITWCTERGSALHLSQDPASRRVLEWEFCLWQFWLNAFGDVEIFPSTKRDAVDLRLNYAARKLHQRVVAKYRAETCLLAGKRMQALEIERTMTAQGIMNKDWLTRACIKIESEK